VKLQKKQKQKTKKTTTHKPVKVKKSVLLYNRQAACYVGEAVRIQRIRK
jgi:hypothetical protein